MEVRIQSIHFDASEQLQSFVQKKVAKLEKFYDDIKKSLQNGNIRPSPTNWQRRSSRRQTRK